MAPTPEPKPRGKRIVRIVAPLVLALGLLLVVEVGLFDMVKATMRYDLTPFPTAEALHIAVINDKGERVSKAFFRFDAPTKPVEQTIQVPPGPYKVNARLNTPSGDKKAAAEVTLKRDGTYEVRLVEVPGSGVP